MNTKSSSFVFISYFLLLLLLMVFGNKKKTHAGNDEYKEKSSIEGETVKFVYKRMASLVGGRFYLIAPRRQVFFLFCFKF